MIKDCLTHIALTSMSDSSWVLWWIRERRGLRRYATHNIKLIHRLCSLVERGRIFYPDLVKISPSPYGWAMFILKKEDKP